MEDKNRIQIEMEERKKFEENEQLKEEAKNIKKAEISRLQSILPDEPLQSENVCFYLLCFHGF